MLNSEQKETYQKLAQAHLNTQKQRHALLEEQELTSSSLEKIAWFDQQEKEQRKTAKQLIQKANPDQETNDKDYVFISFILGYLPHGIIGLLLAVILSAAMSSTASELNALAATTTIDLYQRNRQDLTQEHYVNASKLFTLMWGGIAILFAAFGSLVENLIQLVNIIGSVFYGTILGVFLVAFFLKKVKGAAVFWSAVISEILILFIFFQDWIGFLWLNVIGALFTILLSLILQALARKK